MRGLRNSPDKTKPLPDMLCHSLVFPLFIAVFLYVLPAQGQAARPGKPQVAYLENPLGLDHPNPRLGWQPCAAEQTAYQVLVASTAGKLARGEGDLWDSGKVAGGTASATYAGKQPGPRQRCHWKVRTWDGNGQASAWSRPAFWETGLTGPDDWQARWIRHPAFDDGKNESRPAPYFRKDFALAQIPVKARAYVAGLGYFEFYVNGEKVGDHLLDPVKTRYDRSVKYVVFDLEGLLAEGGNTLGLVLGTGWYNHFAKAAWGFDNAPWRSYPEARCQVELEFADGSRQVVGTGPDWKASDGPIRFDGIRNGETYDARLEMPGWDRPGFDDSRWVQALPVAGPAGRLTAQDLPPIRAMAEIRPVAVTQPEPGVWVFDLGQNIAGFCRLKTAGPKGSEISLKMGEKRFPNGLVEQAQILRFLKTGEAQTDRYILKGDGVEVWQPRFVYHGFQYVEVRGLAAPPTLETVTGIVIHTAFDRAGTFACSDPLLNQLQQNMEWAFVGNYHGLPTDCPHREKIGWTGDAHLVAETGLFFFAVQAAYLKWLDDFVDEQRENGDLPGVIPTSGWGYELGRNPETRAFGYGPQWEGALVQMAWDLYSFTGDTSVLVRYYQPIKKYLGFLRANAQDHTLFFGIDDHKPVTTKTLGDILASGYLVGFTKMFSEMAAVLGHTHDAQDFAAYSDTAARAFHQKYFDPPTGKYGNGGQTSQAMALYFGIAPEHLRAAVLDSLLAGIRQSGYRFDAGVVGLKFLFNVLREEGQSEALYRMAAHHDIPGFGYWVAQGANTLWQDWDGSMSHNHIMFATLNEWFFEGLAGIQQDAGQPGFKHFHVRPDILPQLGWVTASHESPNGTLAVAWEKKNQGLELRVTVPLNSTATVHFPEAFANALTHNGESLPPGRRVLQVGPGKHAFFGR